VKKLLTAKVAKKSRKGLKANLAKQTGPTQNIALEQYERELLSGGYTIGGAPRPTPLPGI
jgi:hypothetical protein